MLEVDFFSLEGCIKGLQLPEDEEELFVDAVAAHVTGKSFLTETSRMFVFT